MDKYTYRRERLPATLSHSNGLAWVVRGPDGWAVAQVPAETEAKEIAAGMNASPLSAHQ